MYGRKTILFTKDNNSYINTCLIFNVANIEYETTEEKIINCYIDSIPPNKKYDLLTILEPYLIKSSFKKLDEILKFDFK